MQTLGAPPGFARGSSPAARGRKQPITNKAEVTVLEQLTRWVCSDDRKQRLRIHRSLLAAVVFIACCVLQVYACWMGYMAAGDVKLLSGAIVVNVLFWYGMLRSGLNLRFADPALTLPQILEIGRAHV